MKLSEWIKANNIPNNRILKVLEYYESIDPISFNDPEDKMGSKQIWSS